MGNRDNVARFVVMRRRMVYALDDGVFEMVVACKRNEKKSVRRRRDYEHKLRKMSVIECVVGKCKRCSQDIMW